MKSLNGATKMIEASRRARADQVETCLGLEVRRKLDPIWRLTFRSINDTIWLVISHEIFAEDRELK